MLHPQMPSQLKNKIEATWKKHCSETDKADRFSKLSDKSYWALIEVNNLCWNVPGALSCGWFGWLVRATHRWEKTYLEHISGFLEKCQVNMIISKHFRQTRNGWETFIICHGRLTLLEKYHTKKRRNKTTKTSESGCKNTATCIPYFRRKLFQTTFFWPWLSRLLYPYHYLCHHHYFYYYY